MRWKIKHKSVFEDESLEMFDVYDLKSDTPHLPCAVVWHDLDDGKVRCAECAGPLTPMRRNCPHAKAVNRHLRKHQAPS